MRIQVINGPNLNLLGLREPQIYGTLTLAEIERQLIAHVGERPIELSFFQSNHEGAIVDCIQDCLGRAEGIIINPAAYTHTSIAILDALKAVAIPTVEVHLSDIRQREDFRRQSYTALAACQTIVGKGVAGYLEALDSLWDYSQGEA
ncbi:MAG: type II 3-dehydroquinate dehydratase [Eubacteriales bacterium]|nr:type II 3-dehydroquinate dehydratase [Eubacteriales bacterium]